MSRREELAQELVEYGRRLWERNLVGATEGNLSARWDDGHFLITSSGRSKGHLCVKDVILLRMDGTLADANPTGRPSSEWEHHAVIYRHRPDVQAVIHAHPPVATSYAVADEPIPANVMPEAVMVLGPVAHVPFGLTGTPALGQALEPYVGGHKTFLLAHHGATVLGASVADACHRMETLERVAQVLLVANQLGGAKPLPDDVFAPLAQQYLNGNL